MVPRQRALLGAFVIALFLLIAWIVAVDHYDETTLAHERKQVETSAVRYGNLIASVINQRISILDGLHAYTELTLAQDGNINQPQLAAYAVGLHDHISGLYGFSVAPDGVHQYVYPLEPNAALLGHDAESLGLQPYLAQAIATGQPAFSRPYELPGRGLALGVLMPVEHGGDEWGFVAVSIDLNTTLGELPVDDDLLIGITTNDDTYIYGERNLDDPVSYCVPVGTDCWQVLATPRAGWGAADRQATQLFRLGGLAIVGLLTVLSYQTIGRQLELRQAVGARTAEISNAHRHLQLRHAVNLAVRHAANEHDLIQRVCQAVVETGGYAGASVCFEATVPAAAAGAIVCQDQCQIGTIALYTSTMQIQNQVIILPLMGDAVTLGALCIRAEHELGADEQAHLTELAAEVASGIVFFRTRLAHQQSDTALRRSERNYRHIIENNVDGIVIVNEKGFVRFVNPAAEALLGRDAHDLMNSYLGFPLAGETATEITLLRPDDTTVTCDMRVVETNWGGQAVSMATLRDVTERHEAAKHSLALALERERTRILTDFVRNASHQFRTPLSTIQTNLSLLGLINEPEERQRLLSKIDEKTSVIVTLVEALVRLSRLDTTATFQAVPLNLNAVVSEAVNRFQHRSIVVEMADELPPIEGDFAELQYAVGELLQNAVRFTPESGTIAVTTYHDNGSVVAEVRDTGIGMDAETQARVFERFFRQDPSQDADGLGLGLSIVQKIVQGHGGHIDLTSAPEQGSVFRLKLPPATLS